MHDALKPGGLLLFIVPTFGDIDHGFYNVHPTTYLHLTEVNNYRVEDFCHVDRWDIRNEMYDADPSHVIDFETMPIQLEQMKDRTALQVKATELFVANFLDPATNNCRNVYSGVIYDYCCVAQRKTKAGRLRYPMQRYYWQAGHRSTR
jgi:hypothetical protein